jgi:glycosyltransferase involved in cell wall biosynthesis
MNKKIKILVIPSDHSGCGKFRSVDPHKYIQEHYGDEFDVDIVYGMPNEKLEDFLMPYDIVHIHKQLDKDCKVIDLMKFLGKKVIVDVDDNPFLGNDHPMSLSAKKERWFEPIIKHLEKADYVTTTTPIFASFLKKYNKNVKVFPNAVDPTEEQFSKPKEEGNGKLRVGIICGSSHMKDLELLGNIAKQVDPTEVQFVLCGFDTRGTRTIYHQDTNQIEKRPILPQESVWCEYEKIFTDNYRTISKEHKDFLMQYAANVDDPFTDEGYRRMWTRDINNYATHYSAVDVLIAPLKENDFNKMKSQLKEVECGFTHTAFIGQNFGAYTIDLTSMIGKGGNIDETATALLVDTSKNHKQWGKFINKLAKDRDMLKKLQDNLHELVKDKYSLENVTKERVEFYKKLVEE